MASSFPNFTELSNVLGQKSLNLNQSYPNFTEQLQIATESAQKLIEIVNTLSHLQNTSTSTAGVVDNILLMVQELLMLHNDSTALPTSCIKRLRRHNQTVNQVCICWLMLMEEPLMPLIVIWRNCVVPEEDGQD